jgi:hypothetical protein
MFHPVPRADRWDPIIVLAVVCFVGLLGLLSMIAK